MRVFALQLSDETRELRDKVLGGQMQALNVGYGETPYYIDDDEVIIPATHIPTPANQHWSTRSHAAFHPTDNDSSPKAIRRTQPPAVFALKGLDLPPLRPAGKEGLKTLNLSDQVITRDPEATEHVPPRRVPTARHGQLRPLTDDGKGVDDHRPPSPDILPPPMDFYAPAPQ